MLKELESSKTTLEQTRILLSEFNAEMKIYKEKLAILNDLIEEAKK